MSDNDEWYLKSHKPSLRGWIFTQMTLGAVYAAVVFFGVIAVILIIYAVSFLLPEDPFAALAPALSAIV
ncbi:MAG: RC-LH1 core complex protein PufX [Rhodobacteraceae bacterium]|nr:RC-LH1 core complex protein PufX [Paracoccaceae bacterium]